MRILNYILKVNLSILVVLSILQCGIRSSKYCESYKIELLFEDIFNKRDNYPKIKRVQPLDNTTPDESVSSYSPTDSSKYFIYLYSSNLKIPEKEFYLHMSKTSDISYPDSVKIRVTKEPSPQNKYTQMLGIELIEVNEDTSKLKIMCGYSKDLILLTEATYTYSFDDKTCKWNVLDSNIWRY